MDISVRSRTQKIDEPQVRFGLWLWRKFYSWAYMPYLWLICAPIAMLQVLYARRMVSPQENGSSQLDAGANLSHVLLILLDHIGDTAVALPLLLGLRRDFPAAQFTIVTHSGLAELFADWENCDILIADHDDGKWHRWFSLPRQRWLFARRHFHGRHFDVCIIPRQDVDFQCALLLGYFSGAPHRISFSETATGLKRWHNKHYDRLLTCALSGAMGAEAHQLLRIRAQLPAGSLGPPLPRLRFLDSAWVQSRLSPELRWVAVCPSEGSSPLKQWGLLQRWLDVSRALTQQGFGIVLVGGKQDQPLARAIARGLNQACVDVTGQTNLSQLGALLQACALFLGNDCGPLHLASAINVPSVAVLGSTCSHRYGVWSDRGTTLKQELACSPCVDHRRDRCVRCIYSHPKCLSDISVSSVVEAALRLLATRPA